MPDRIVKADPKPITGADLQSALVAGDGIIINGVPGSGADPFGSLLVAGTGIGVAYNTTTRAWTVSNTGGGVSDGDKGDITVSGSGATWTIDSLAVTNAKINDVAWSKVSGTPTTLSGYGITDSVALTTGKLSQFAATTSSELAGVISDETGSGALVFATSPTLTTPNIGAATGASLLVNGLLDRDGPDGARVVMFRGLTKAIRFDVGVANTTIASTDRSGSISYQPISIDASSINLNAQGGAITFSGSISFGLTTHALSVNATATENIQLRNNGIGAGTGVKITSVLGGFQYGNIAIVAADSVYGNCVKISEGSSGERLVVNSEGIISTAKLTSRSITEVVDALNPKTLYVYNTFTSSTSHERGKLEWASNVFRIGTEKGSAGGSARALEFQTDGTTRLTIGTTGSLTIADALDIAVGSTTGTKIGTATTQKIGFFNKAPVVQPSAVADATDAPSVITQLNALLSRMRDLGLIAT